MLQSMTDLQDQLDGRQRSVHKLGCPLYLYYLSNMLCTA